MTDRDTFAAAALTGLIVSMREESLYEVCQSAFGWADAMIRQRGTAVSDNCVAGNQPEIPCPVTEPMPVVVSGSGSVTPVPYAEHDGKRVDWHTAVARLTDAEREAVECAANQLDNSGWSSAALRALLARLA